MYRPSAVLPSTYKSIRCDALSDDLSCSHREQSHNQTDYDRLE